MLRGRKAVGVGEADRVPAHEVLYLGRPRSSVVVEALERALSARASGPPGWPTGICMVSSTKNWPVGVGVEGLPITA